MPAYTAAPLPLMPRRPMSDTFLSPRRLIPLFLVFTLVWFGTLEFRKLIKPDEGRYAEIAREMVESGDWITPRLNGIKYFEKPPLQYWMTALAFKTFGEDEWSARLWGGATGFLGVLLAYFTGRRLFGPNEGLLAALVLASSLFYVAIGHINTLDMGLTFFLQLAISAFLLAQRPGLAYGAERNWMLVAWAAAALAVLSKGFVALVLPGATLVVYSLANRDWQPWRRLHIWPGLALLLLIAAPWMVAASRANPEFFHFFFIHEHFERFLTKAHHRYQPWWYFGPILLMAMVPWTTLAMHALATAWRRHGGDAARPARFLTIFSVLTFVFFSASDSKLPSYILPILPPLALLTGAFLARIERRTLLAHLDLVLITAIGALALSPFVSRQADKATPFAMMNAYENWLIVSACLWCAASLLAVRLARGGRRELAALSVAVGAFAGASGMVLGHERLGRSNSSYHIAREVKRMLPPGAPFYSVRMYEQTLPFYLQRTVTLVAYRDEMGFGLDQEPQLGIPTVAAFEQRWREDNDAFAVMTEETYKELSAHGLPMRIVAQDTRRIIVRKTPS